MAENSDAENLKLRKGNSTQVEAYKASAANGEVVFDVTKHNPVYFDGTGHAYHGLTEENLSSVLAELITEFGGTVPT